MLFRCSCACCIFCPFFLMYFCCIGVYRIQSNITIVSSSDFCSTDSKFVHTCRPRVIDRASTSNTRVRRALRVGTLQTDKQARSARSQGNASILGGPESVYILQQVVVHAQFHNHSTRPTRDKLFLSYRTPSRTFSIWRPTSIICDS